ncbi:MAG: WD40 repeat domain-containing protein [Candidatus Dependentiae bacterium]
MKLFKFIFNALFFCSQIALAGEIPALKQLAAQQLAYKYQNSIFTNSLVAEYNKKLPEACINLINKELQSVNKFSTLTLKEIAQQISYFGVSYSPDGKIIATIHDKTINLFSTENGKHIGALQEHEQTITDTIFMDDYTLISASIDKTLKMWDLKKHILITSFQTQAEVKSIKLSGDKHYLYAFLENGVIEVWSLKSHELYHTINAQFDGSDLFYSKRFNKAKTKVVFIQPDNSLIIVDLLQATITKTTQIHELNILDIAITENTPIEYIITASSDHRIKICDMHTAKVIRTLEDNNITNDNGEILGESHAGAVYAVIVNKNEIISASQDGTIKSWDIFTGECLKAWHAHAQPIFNLYLFNNGKNLISCSQSGEIKMWDVLNSKCQRTIQAHASSIHYLKFLDKNSIATASLTDGTLKVWDLFHGSCLFCKFITNKKHAITDVYQTKLKLSPNKGGLLVIDNGIMQIMQSEKVTITSNKKSLLNMLALLIPSGMIFAGAVGAMSIALSHYR